jgi:hypothetical protein
VPDVITPNKGLTQPQIGIDTNWASLLNTDLSLIDTVLGGTLTLSVSGNTTLSATRAENTGYNFAGTLTADATITWPSFFGFAFIENNTVGGFSISCGIRGGAFATLFNGESVSIWSDGINFIKTTEVGAGHGDTGTGAVVLATSPTISSPTINSPTISGSPILSSPLSVHNGGTGSTSYGPITGVSASKTSAYAVANSDKGHTLAFSGGFYTVTIPAASGFDADFQVLIYNADTGRGKELAIAGFSNLILWPGKKLLVQNVGGAWAFEQPSRWRPPFSPTFYIDNVNGSDSSDGLDSSGAGAGCFKTVQHAVDTCYLQLDIVSFAAATIQLPPTTSAPITENVTMGGSLGGYQFDLLIRGNPSTPINCQWFLPNGSSGAACISVTDYATVTLDGIAFGVTSGNVPFLLSGRQLCIIDIENCYFANNSTQVAMKVQDAARINILQGGITIGGNFADLFQIQSQGMINATGITFNVFGTPNIGNFIFMGGAGCVMDIVGSTFTGNTSGIGGTQYAIQGPNVFYQTGISWPAGIVGGSATDGGVVI